MAITTKNRFIPSETAPEPSRPRPALMAEESDAAPADAGDADEAGPDEEPREEEEGPIHRRLIREFLPPYRRRCRRRRASIPEFTIRQPARPSHLNRFRGPRPARGGPGGGGGQQFPGNRSGGGGSGLRRSARNGGGCARVAAVVRSRAPAAVRRAATDPSAAGARNSKSASNLKHLNLPFENPPFEIPCLIPQASTASSSASPTSARSRGGLPRRRPPRANWCSTYPSERLEENVRELAATLDNPLILLCDVERRSADRDARRDARARIRRPRLPGPRRCVCAGRCAEESVYRDLADSFRIALDISAYSLIGLTRAVTPLMEQRGGGSVLTLTFIGSDRVFTNYNVMGVAKAALESSVRYLAYRSWSEEHPGERDLGRRDQDPRVRRHLRDFDDAAGVPRQVADAPRRGTPRRSPTRRCFCSARRRAA